MILPTLRIQIERWRFNEEFGVYVSTLGHFKDRHKRNLPYKINQRGYCHVHTENGVCSAHRLVLFTWRPIPNREEMTVDHLNHNKRDNSLANLEWVTQEENSQRGVRDRIDFTGDPESKPEVLDIDLIILDGILMSIEQAIVYVMIHQHGTKSAAVRESIAKFFSNDSVKEIKKYGFVWKKVYK